MTLMCGERWLETGSPFAEGDNMNNQSFYMHPRYNEFLAFLNTVDTDARINPNALNLAFDVWLESVKVNWDKEVQQVGLLVDISDENKILKADLDRLHRERDSFQRQSSVLAEEVERLNELFLVGFGYAVGERGDACVSVDGGNL
jgi:hypothetical protein